MAQVRDRLNKGYEIYHAEDPTFTVHRFEANTPAKKHDAITKRLLIATRVIETLICNCVEPQVLWK
jgi:hypothetical protein